MCFSAVCWMTRSRSIRKSTCRQLCQGKCLQGHQGLSPAHPPETFIQTYLRPQAMRYSPLDPLTVLPERSQYTVGFFLDDLYLANARQINPFTGGDVIRQCLEVAFDGFADECFGECPPLPGDVGNTLCVVHLG